MESVIFINFSEDQSKLVEVLISDDEHPGMRQELNLIPLLGDCQVNVTFLIEIT